MNENEIENAEFSDVKPEPQLQDPVEPKPKVPTQPTIEDQVTNDLIFFITSLLFPQDPKNPANINLVGNYCKQAKLTQYLVDFAKKYNEENK